MVNPVREFKIDTRVMIPAMESPLVALLRILTELDTLKKAPASGGYSEQMAREALLKSNLDEALTFLPGAKEQWATVTDNGRFDLTKRTP